MADLSLTAALCAALNDTPLQLPVHSAVARRAAGLLSAGRPQATELAALAATDPVLASSLLRAANGAFYAGLPRISSLEEALCRIGCAVAGQVVASACREGKRAAGGRFSASYLEPLWQHSLGCALGAAWLARRCGYPGLVDLAHLAGLLHDFGKWLLLAGLGRLAGDGHAGGNLGDRLIEEVLASLHVELGLRLATEWHLPAEVAGVIGGHHETELDGQQPLLALVRLANLGCRKLGLGWARDPDLVLPTTAEAQMLSLDELAMAEFEIMLEDRFQLVSPCPPSATVGNLTNVHTGSNV